MGKYVDKRMAELGAVRMYPLGLGDDDANMEDDFITWKDGMWPKVDIVGYKIWVNCALVMDALPPWTNHSNPLIDIQYV